MYLAIEFYEVCIPLYLWYYWFCTLDCFAWIALVASLLCTCTLGVVPSESVVGGPVAVSGVGVLVVQIIFRVVGYMVKACGHLIFGNSKYLIAFVCALPSMISWLLQIWLGMLCYHYADVRHMILDYAQTVLCMVQFVPWVDLVFFVIPDQIVAELGQLAGCCSQLLY